MEEVEGVKKSVDAQCFMQSMSLRKKNTAIATWIDNQ